MHASGLLILNKPSGESSGKISRHVGRLLGVDKIGHGGTLDPMAEGVLPLLLGHATKLSDIIMQDEKSYRATVCLGIETDTYDKEGEVKFEKPVPPDLTRESMVALLSEFKGDLQQMPPAFSAKKIKGVKAYELARKNKPVLLKEKSVTIHDIVLEEFSLPHVTFSARVSKGTYIRSLAHDLGSRLGCGAHLSALTRTACGAFSLSRSVNLTDLERAASLGTLDEIYRTSLISENELISHLPAITIDPHFTAFVLGQGNLQTPWIYKELKALRKQTPGVRLIDRDGRLLALLRRNLGLNVNTEDNPFAYLRVFKSPSEGDSTRRITV